MKPLISILNRISLFIVRLTSKAFLQRRRDQHRYATILFCHQFPTLYGLSKLIIFIGEVSFNQTQPASCHTLTHSSSKEALDSFIIIIIRALNPLICFDTLIEGLPIKALILLHYYTLHDVLLTFLLPWGVLHSSIQPGVLVIHCRSSAIFIQLVLCNPCQAQQYIYDRTAWYQCVIK